MLWRFFAAEYQDYNRPGTCLQTRWRLGLAVLAVSCFVPSLSAVIVEVRQYHGKQVTCAYSGLMGVAKGCGTDGYERVFTGVVRSSVEVGDTDKLLEIVPDEIFVGDSGAVTAITNQACLSADIQVGDKWLFYLQRDTNKEQDSHNDPLVLSYGGRSEPISGAEDDISMLRDLGRLKNTGILIGTVEHLGDTEDAKPTPLANHKVVAKNVANGTKYTTTTNEKGYFKFDLPVGKYDVTTTPEYGLREVEGFGSMRGSVSVEKRQCWEHDFAVKPATSVVPPNDGTISGHLGSPDGKPFMVHPWVQIVSVDSEMFTSAYVDAKGFFEAKNVKPGRYVVGIGIQPGQGISVTYLPPSITPAFALRKKQPPSNFVPMKNARM